MNLNHKTMKAAITTEYGAPEVISVQTVPIPIPKDNEYLIQIHASAINSADVRTRALHAKFPLNVLMRMVLGMKRPRNAILGTVYAGVNLSTQENVFGCTPGMKFSTHTEYVTIPKDSAIYSMPTGATFEEAVALLFGFTTALFFLEKMNPSPNQSILIYGASGSVGLAAVQISKIYGLTITTVTSSQNQSRMKDYGVQQALDYTHPDFERSLTKYDIVFDCVGLMDKKLAKQNARHHYITVGGSRVAKETKEQLKIIKNWYETQRITPVIDRIYTLDDIIEAHRYVDSHRKVGTVVLKVV